MLKYMIAMNNKNVTVYRNTVKNYFTTVFCWPKSVITLYKFTLFHFVKKNTTKMHFKIEAFSLSRYIVNILNN